MLHPVDQDYFFKHVYKKKAIIIKAHSDTNRLSKVINEEMFGLKIKDLLENSASEMLHIWHPPKGNSKAKKMTISNVDTEDVAEALKAYKQGASLYFGSSLDFRNSWCK
jgi:hypothetical protein